MQWFYKVLQNFLQNLCCNTLFLYLCNINQYFIYMLQLRIKEICKEQGITLNTLAERIGVTQPSISGLATGKIKPSLDTLEKLSQALDVEVGELFTPKNDFIAFVRSNGQTHTFTSVEDLREYVITSEGLYLCCNEDAPASEMCQDEAQETKSETPDTERQ